MEQSQQEQVTLTPKLIFQKIIQARNLILKNWWLLLIFIAIGTAIGYYIDSKKNTRNQYIAQVVFSVSGGGSQDMGAFGNIFGMNMGGTSESNLFKGENLFYIAKTRPVLERALLTSVKIPNSNKEDLFINYYIDSTFVQEDDWKTYYPDLVGIKIKHTSRDSMGKKERMAFDHILSQIKNNEVDMLQPDLKTAFYHLDVRMTNEMVSKTFADLFLKTIQFVYEQNQNQKSKEMEGILTKRVAELAGQLNSTENKLAQTAMVNAEAVAPTAKVAETRLTRQSSFVSGLYLEAARNLENLRMSKLKEAPLFTVIEPVVLPLEIKQFSRQNTKFGAALALLLAIVFILIKDTYLEALRDLKQEKAQSKA